MCDESNLVAVFTDVDFFGCRFYRLAFLPLPFLPVALFSVALFTVAVITVAVFTVALFPFTGCKVAGLHNSCIYSLVLHSWCQIIPFTQSCIMSWFDC